MAGAFGSDAPGAAGGGDVGVSNVPNVAVPRARTGTLRRSCEACRTLKARCVVDLEGPARQRRCERCTSNGLECVFEEAIARPKRVRAAPRARVKDVEEKLDSLIALIAARNGGAAQGPGQWPPNISGVGVAPASEFMLTPESTTAFFASMGLPYIAPGSEPPTTSLDVFSKGLVSFEQAERYLSAFYDGNESFPFVVRAPHVTLDYLRRERPALLLAIMVISSDSPVQDKLAVEFRRLIGQTVVVEATKSIDLVQGLILYCSWHHRCINPNLHQLYQLTQLAVSMTVDLGLPQLARLSTLNVSRQIGPAVTNRAHNPEYWDELERIRTYLGSYYVSHCLSISLRKPTHFKHSKRIEEAAKLIASLGHSESDFLITYHIRLQKFARDVESVFQYNDPDGMDEMDGVKIYAMVKAFERQLQDLRASLPSEVWANNSIQLEYLFLRIYITEICLQVPHRGSIINPSSSDQTTPPSSVGSPSSSPSSCPCCNWCPSPLRTEVLLSCIRAAQLYLDKILSLSDSELRGLNVMEIGRHCYSILVLGRIAMTIDTRHLDHVMLSKVANIQKYLEATAQRMNSMITYLDGGKPKMDSFWQLSQVFSQATRWCLEQGQLTPDVDMDGEACALTLDFSAIMAMRPPNTESDSAESPPEVMPIPTPMVAPQPVQQPTPESPWIDNTDMLWQDLGMSPQPNWFTM